SVAHRRFSMGPSLRWGDELHGLYSRSCAGVGSRYQCASRSRASPGKSMRLLPLAAALSLVLAGAAPAQRGPSPDFSADRFKSHVAFLADDLLEGRDTGSRGHEIAAAYVASQFLGLGLKPGGA